MDAQSWDDMYESHDRVFSGEPNGVLVAEAGGLPPGQALDVGCGEGADALWLARRGWLVTAIDISQVALRRAAAAGAGVAGRVSWTHADLAGTPPPAAAFDLVTAQYFPLPRHRPAALHGLLAAVAPGGTLLVASHDPADLPDFDPGGYYLPGDIARMLGEDWAVLADETRPRTVPAPPGSRHTHDTVLRARRVR